MWSDVANKVIFAARLNGTGVSILVNSSINVPGNIACVCILFCFCHALLDCRCKSENKLL